MKQSQFYYLLRRGLFSGGSAIIKSGLVMFNKFTTAGLSFPVQGSAAFNRTSDYIQTNDIDDVLGTFSCWLYTPTEITSSLNPGAVIIDFDKDLPERIIVLGSFSGLMSGEVISIGGFGDNYWRSYSTTNVPAGWSYLTITYPSANTYKMYLNGSELSVLNAGFSPVQIPIKEMIIGGRMDDGSTFINGFLGNLANVAIWNRALTSDEINSVMWKPVQALSATESNGLQAWYSLDDIASPTASLASMEQLATDKNLIIENKAAVTAAINKLS